MENYTTAVKLNYFHHFLKQLTGYALHPTIQQTVHYRIADLGTQTCVWPISLADDVNNNLEIDAFDICSDYFPPQSWLPSTLKLHIHDIKVPFPQIFHETFNVVHLRLFLHLTVSEMDVILQNAMEILKPGGYIQWTEHDKSNSKTTVAVPGTTSEATDMFLEVQRNPFPNYNFRWVNEIAPAMVKNGLLVEVEERIQVRPSMLPQMNELHLISLLDVPLGVSKPIDEFRKKHFEDLKQEYSQGVSTIDGFICIVGKKVMF